MIRFPDNLIQLEFDTINLDMHRPLLFVTKCSNLQEFVLISHGFYNSKGLPHVTLPRLRILKFPCHYPDRQDLTEYLKIHGRNLKELWVWDDSLNPIIAEFCPNLKSLCTAFGHVESLKELLNGCQQLERLKSNEYLLSRGELLQTVAKHSPENFQELKLYNHSELFPDELESFFMSWSNRMPRKSLSLIFIWFGSEKGVTKVIEKFKRLGVVKKFEIIRFDESNYDQ